MVEIIPALNRHVLAKMTGGEKRVAHRLRDFLEVKDWKTESLKRIIKSEVTLSGDDRARMGLMNRYFRPLRTQRMKPCSKDEQ